MASASFASQPQTLTGSGARGPPQVTAKSKLEQAVFFGIKDDNPLVFEGRRASQFSSLEIGEAALQLSHEILSSRTPFIVNLPASLEYNLRTRSNYLDKLMSHLNALGVALDRRVRWALLWNAEKMATAMHLWVQHEQFIAERADSRGTEKKSMISEIVEYIHEDEKTNPNQAVGEVDRVRHFFIHDVWRLEIFIAWAYEVIKYVYKDQLIDDKGINRLLYEAVEVNTHALRNALEYRHNKLSFYGLGGEIMENDTLVHGYEGLPEPWTSTYFITNNLSRLVDLCCTWLNQTYAPRGGAPGPLDPALVDSIRENLPQLTNCYFVALLEHSRWAATRDDAQQQKFGERCAKLYREDRYAKIYRLKDYDLWERAVEVAERHHSLDAMAEVMVEQVRSLRSRAAARETGPSRAGELRALAKPQGGADSQLLQKARGRVCLCRLQHPSPRRGDQVGVGLSRGRRRLRHAVPQDEAGAGQNLVDQRRGAGKGHRPRRPDARPSRPDGGAPGVEQEDRAEPGQARPAGPSRRNTHRSLAG